MNRSGTRARGDSAITDALRTIRLVAFDFDGVFTDNTVYVSQEGIESVRCWRSDGIGLARLRATGVETLIVSTEMNPVVTVRATKLKTRCMQGVDDKAAAIEQHCTALGIQLAETAFVGNDVNDIPALRAVGLPIAVADAYPEILPFVRHQTVKPGGHGAVREVCDLVFNARQAPVLPHVS
jgi:YrbI family 3-deoxy-D-manno-octulosonate 8-phosphate phosphatase